MLTESEKRLVHDWALARERAKSPDNRITVVVADGSTPENHACYTVVNIEAFTATVPLEELEADA